MIEAYPKSRTHATWPSTMCQVSEPSRCSAKSNKECVTYPPAESRRAVDRFQDKAQGRVKSQCLDDFIVFAAQHLRHMLSTWLDFCHRFRPHRGLGNGARFSAVFRLF